MASLNKILSKVNSASSALKSVKGLKSKISNTDYKKTIADLSNYDALKELADKEREILEGRRSRLNQDEDAANKMKSIKAAKRPPARETKELQYPLEKLNNYLEMRIRPRKQQNSGANAKNLMNDTDTYIYMYVPTGQVSEAKVSYKEADVGVAARGVMDFMGADGFVDASMAIGDALNAAISSGLNKMANMATGDVVNFAQGQAVNPMKEQMLEGVGFRSFNMEFTMRPVSQEEADVCKEIIYTLRTAMLPDTFGSDESNQIENYFNYPNIVDLRWEGPIAKTMDGFLPAVITDASVTYGGGSTLETFSDGTPLEMKLNLSFTEIKVLTQETYQLISPHPKADTSIGVGNNQFVQLDERDRNNG